MLCSGLVSFGASGLKTVTSVPSALSLMAAGRPYNQPRRTHPMSGEDETARSYVALLPGTGAFVTGASLLADARNYCLRGCPVSRLKKCKYLSLRPLHPDWIWRLECHSTS